METNRTVQVVVDAILALRLQFANLAEDDGGLADARLVQFLVRQIGQRHGIVQLGIGEEEMFCQSTSTNRSVTL